jgi:hypothetical protein
LIVDLPIVELSLDLEPAMTEVNPVPQTVKACLDAAKLHHVPPNLRLAPHDQVEHLRSLCEQMLARVRAEPDPNRFADLRDLANEAASLAASLGFACPPIQPLHYQRGHNHAADPLPLWGWPSYPLYWRMIGQLRTEQVHLWGYRLHDPANPALFCEFNCRAEAERQGPDGPERFDPWADQSKFVYRTRTVEFLQKWLRVLAIKKRSRSARPRPARPAASGPADS